ARESGNSSIPAALLTKTQSQEKARIVEVEDRNIGSRNGGSRGKKPHRGGRNSGGRGGRNGGSQFPGEGSHAQFSGNSGRGWQQWN
ncbi:hypothetical protein A2U01_0085157, partial [Trifolium medium]|nr:hypothetical protein [Trifolium medium]